MEDRQQRNRVALRSAAAVLFLVVMLLPLSSVPTVAQGSNSPPKLLEQKGPLKAPIGVRTTFNVEAIDADDDALSYSLLSGPEGMYMVNPFNGLISYLPKLNDTGDKTFLVMVDDGKDGGKMFQNMTVHIVPAPTPVVEIKSPASGAELSGIVTIQGYVDTRVDVEAYVNITFFASLGTPEGGNYMGGNGDVSENCIVPEGARYCNFSVDWNSSEIWIEGRYILEAYVMVGLEGDPSEMDTNWVNTVYDYQIVNIVLDPLGKEGAGGLRTTIIEPAMDAFVLQKTTIVTEVYVPEERTLTQAVLDISDRSLGMTGQTFTNKSSFKGPGNVSLSWDVDLTNMRGSVVEISLQAYALDSNSSSFQTNTRTVVHVTDDGVTNKPYLAFMNPWDGAGLTGEVKVTAFMSCTRGLTITSGSLEITRPPGSQDKPPPPFDLKFSDRSCPKAEIIDVPWDTQTVPDNDYELSLSLYYAYDDAGTMMKGQQRTSIKVTLWNTDIPWWTTPVLGSVAWLLVRDPQDGAIRSDQETFKFEGYVYDLMTGFGGSGGSVDINMTSPVVSTLSLYDNGVEAGKYTGAGSYEWSMTVGPLVAGVHNFTLLLDSSLDDGSFATSTSSSITVTVIGSGNGGVVPVTPEPSLVGDAGSYKNGVVTSEDGTVSFKAPALSGNKQAAFYLWDFGDGNSSVDAAPMHTYSGPGNYTVKLTISDGAKTYSFTNSVVVHGGVESRSGDGGQPIISVGGNAQLYIIISALVLCVVGLFLGGTEMGLYAIFPFFVWLYTKIKNVEVLDHYLRGKIHGYIIANPGEHYNQIKDALCLNNGSLAYHLRVLEREGYVKSLREGVYKRFYPASATMPVDRLTPMERLIIREIKDRVGITQKEIAERIDESPQVVNYHIKNMESKGIVRLERYGRETLCYAAEDYVPRHPWEKVQT